MGFFPEPDLPHGRDLLAEGRTMARDWQLGPSAFLRHVGAASEFDFKRDSMAKAGVRVMVATSDVHEHGKMLVEEILRRSGATVLDGGVSTDPAALATRVQSEQPDAVAISTYNGVALDYYHALRAAGVQGPVLIGGRLNQIPEGSNSSLPVDVGDQLAKAGAIVCRSAAGLMPRLDGLDRSRKEEPSFAAK
jgi:methylmalonyl-CoA mutase cobalamin-binding subunit